MFVLFVVLFSIVSIENVFGDCDKCGIESGVACISETEFNYCFENVPQTDYSENCPVDTVCSDTASVCTKTGPAGCISKCGVCSLNSRFACMSKTTFSLCMGGKSPVSSVRDCPTGKVCSITAPKGQFCTTASATEVPSCRDREVMPLPTTTESTLSILKNTTESSNSNPIPASINPTEICRQKNQFGRFPVETSCREYIYCYNIGGIIQGQKIVVQNGNF